MSDQGDVNIGVPLGTLAVTAPDGPGASTRWERVQQAKAKTQAKLDADPGNPRADAWRAKLAEYEASLKRMTEARD